MPPKQNLIGRRFGKLLVIEETDRNTSGKIRWLCRCDCGNTKKIIGSLLMTGHVISCGCTVSSKHRLFHVWADMLSRCDNPNIRAYKWYGARGITYCKEWKTYNNFKVWAESNGYADNLTLDRIDGNGNYEPNNCRWITQSENSRLAYVKRKQERHTTVTNVLTKEDAYFIKYNKQIPTKILAERFNVTLGTIYHIRNNKTWREL